MALSKKEYSSVDAQPIVLYALTSAGSQVAIPVLVTSNGTLAISSGFDIPIHDFISLSPESLPTTIVYKVGGSSGTTVATLSLTYNGVDISTVTRT